MMSKKTLLFIFFLIVFLSPYFFVFSQFSAIELPFTAIGAIYIHSGTQALMSALATLILAFPCAMGLFWLRSRAPLGMVAFVEYIILLPSLLPRLFVLVSFLNLIPHFPFGILGVVILHAFSELGLASLILHRLLQNHLALYMENAEMMGVSRWRFLRTALPLIYPQLLQISFVLFLFFLSSVSIPLILAGGQYSSLEAVIYQKIVAAHNWNQALNLFAVQMILIGILLMILGAIPTTQSENRVRVNSRFLGLPSGLYLLLFPVAVIFISLLVKIPMGVFAVASQSQVLTGLNLYLAGSLLMGFVAGGLGFILLTGISFFYQQVHLRKWFALIMTPSSVILAFAFFLLPGSSAILLYFKIAIALALGFLPALMRFGLLQKLDKLTEQVEAATLAGASTWKIFSKGIWPQVLPQISLLSGLCAMWAMGDFAVSRVIAGHDLSLAMWTQSLVDQYRWDMALLFSWLILFSSFLVYLFFWSLSYVSHKKLNENV